jgi:hypothetical protein
LYNIKEYYFGALMNLYFKILVIFFLSITSFSNPNEIGKVLKMKGLVIAKRENLQVELKVNSKIILNDTITTKKSSFLKVEFSDKTTITIGPNSEMNIEKFTLDKGSIFKLVKGQFRTKVDKKITKEDKVLINTNLASLAIRGTEFLTNSYIVQGKSVTDTALLKGSIQTTLKDSPSFILNSSEAFNTSQIASNQGITKLSPETVEGLLKNQDSFLPNLQNIDGSFNDINEMVKKKFSMKGSDLKPLSPPSASALSTAAGIGVGLGAGLAAIAANSDDDKDDTSKKEFPEQTRVKQEIKKKAPVKKEIDLVTLPWSIRDAIQRREELREENECFYWFFKKIPGGGEKELFRRERDCNEFENDL